MNGGRNTIVEVMASVGCGCSWKMMTRCLADKCPRIEVWINADRLAFFQITPSTPNVGLGINKRRGTLELVDMIGFDTKMV